MKRNRLLTLSLAATLLLGGAYADDFDFGSDDFDFGSFGGDSSSSSNVEITGELSSDVRAYLNADVEKSSDVKMDGGAGAKLNVKYSGSRADAEVKLKLDSNTLENNPLDVVDEAFISAYLGNFKLEAGKMKSVWGKGDKLHVIDNFNADDYTDFIFPDFLDRRIATPMVKGTYAFDFSGKVLSNVKLEGIYTPFLPTDRFASKGVWVPAQVNAIKNSVTAEASSYLAAAFSNYTTQTATVAVLKSIGADASAAAAALASAQEAVNQLDAVQSYAALLGVSPEVIYNNQTGSSISAAEYAALVQKAQLALSATTLNNQVAGAEYAQALQTAGVASIEEAEANLLAAGTTYMYALNNASALSNNPDMIYPDTNTLDYGQFGGRLNFSLGNVDLGLSYYNGFYHQPSFNGEKFTAYVEKYLSNQTITEEDKFLAYDKKQTFGVEAATILWHFNLRGEACYNLTDDVAGDNPWVHNNSVQWLGGFDIDLPLWNMNVNIQETGTYVLNNDKIADSMFEKADVDYCENGYMNNKVVMNVTTSFKNDQVLPEVTVMYSIESGDVIVMPKFVVKPTSELSLSASGMYIWCQDDNSQFKAWDKNNFVQLGATLVF